MPLDCAFVEIKKFYDGFFVLLRRSERSRNEIVPAFFPAFALFHDEKCARRQLSYTLEDGIGRRSVAKSQEKIERRGVHLRSSIVGCEHRADLRAKCQLPISKPIIDQLDTHGVTRHDQALLTHIPNGQAEHAVEMIEDICAPLFVAVDDYFRVGIRSKLMAFALQFASQF